MCCKIRSWEKQLQQIFDETNVQKLLAASDTAVSKYFDSLPAPGVALPSHYTAGESPFDHLQQAMYCVATAIKVKGKDAALHFRLGMLLEEQFFLENVIGFKVDKVLRLMLSWQYVVDYLKFLSVDLIEQVTFLDVY